MEKFNLEFKAATYLRLSKDDGDFSFSGKTESNSIHNQRELLKNYLLSHPDIVHVAEYADATDIIGLKQNPTKRASL